MQKEIKKEKVKKEPIKMMRVIKTKGTHSFVEARVKNLETEVWETRVVRKENRHIKLESEASPETPKSSEKSTG